MKITFTLQIHGGDRYANYYTFYKKNLIFCINFIFYVNLINFNDLKKKFRLVICMYRFRLLKVLTEISDRNSLATMCPINNYFF